MTSSHPVEAAPARTALAWAAGALAMSWMAALLLVPVVVARGTSGWLARSIVWTIYAAGSAVCHQRPDRSLLLDGVQMPVCARCAGLYAGVVCGSLAALAWSRRARRDRWARVTGLRGLRVWRAALVASALPTGVLVAIEWLGWAAPSGALRAAGAVPLGAVVAWTIEAACLGRFDGAMPDPAPPGPVRSPVPSGSGAMR